MVCLLLCFSCLIHQRDSNLVAELFLRVVEDFGLLASRLLISFIDAAVSLSIIQGVHNRDAPDDRPWFEKTCYTMTRAGSYEEATHK